MPIEIPAAPVMLDLFSGLGGASAAMRDRGWTVYSVDCLEWLRPTVVADVRNLPFEPFYVDLLWASPPCTEFSRTDLPWIKDAPQPDLTLYLATKQIIAKWQPRFWAIENVRGAIPYFGQWQYHFGSRYLWSNIPMLGPVGPLPQKQALWPSNLRYWLRSKVEYPISQTIAASVEACYAHRDPRRSGPPRPVALRPAQLVEHGRSHPRRLCGRYHSGDQS